MSGIISGKVKFYLKAKGYGFLTDAKGGDHFFMRSDAGVVGDKLKPGLPVTFAIQPDVNPKTRAYTERAVMVVEVAC